MSYLDPQQPPTRATLNPRAIHSAQVLVVNADGSVDVRLLTSRSTRHRVPVIAGLSPTLGARVLLAHLDEDPQTPVVIGAL